MIIVEGPDGGGKSTLVKALHNYFGFPIADKVVASDTRPLRDLVTWTEQNVQQGFQHQIFDRHRLISEPIYGPFKSSEPTWSFLNQGWVSEMMWQFYQCKPIIIYALPSLETVRANVYDPSTDNEFIAEWINHIYAGYVARVSIDAAHGVGRLYNYPSTKLDDLFSWISNQLKQRVSDDTSGRLNLPGPRPAPDSSAKSGRSRSSSTWPS